MINDFDFGLADDPKWTLSNYKVQETTEIKSDGTEAAPIERFAHIVEKLKYIWGYPEVAVYLESLVVNTDPNRPTRQGFDPSVKSDILFLYNLYVDQFSIINKDKTATSPFANRPNARENDVWEFSR